MIPTPRRYLRRRRMLGDRDPGFPVPFVVGAPRSGTTLLRLMLDAHPEVAIPSETHFIVPVIDAFRRGRMSPEALAELLATHNRWGDFHLDQRELLARFREIRRFNAADATREFFRLYAEKQGKQRWGDKTPGYVKQMRKVAHLLPEAHFVHIIRDGRDVALSVLAMNWGPSTVTGAAESWRKRILNAREQQQHIPHYIEVHYEDLVLRTEPTLRRVCEYIELDFDAAMLDYHERAEERLREKARDLVRRRNPVQPAELRLASHMLAKSPPQPARVGRWRTEMTPEDVAEYEGVAGDLLAELGYETAVSAGNGRP